MISFFWITTANAQSYTDHSRAVYVELGGRSQPAAIGGEFGISRYIAEYVSVRGGLSFLSTDGFDETFGGAVVGFRVDMGYRISPFVGLGAFLGYTDESVSADRDRIDNDDDGFIDELGEEKTVVTDILGSLFPEIGLQFSVTETTRFIFSSKYQMTTRGRESDYWIYSFGIASFF